MQQKRQKRQIQIQTLIKQHKLNIQSVPQMMNRPKSTTRKSSTHHSTARHPNPTKKDLSDTIYLMQNQNEILKLKYLMSHNQRNQEMTYKLDSLNSELRQRTQRVAQAEKDCQAIRQLINGSVFVHDIELENEKKILLDKILITQQNLTIYKNKISDARKQVVMEEERIPLLMADRVKYEEDLRIAQMENQGAKKILINLENQNQQLRQRNNALSLKKYSKEPEQKTISQEIQQRIRLIKNINFTQKVFKKQATSKLISTLLENLFLSRKKLSFLTIEKHGLKKALIKKKIFLLAHIRKNYLNSVKTKIMAKLRQPFRPIQEQQKFVQILQDIRKRRLRAKIWRIWRNQTAKAEYSLIRKYESQNTIQKICQIITKSVLISSFNHLKYFNNHHRPQLGASKIFSVISNCMTQLNLSVFSQFRQQIRTFELEQQIENSAQSQSELLIMSRMFYGWVALMKDKKKESLALKFKYFKKLKKIFIIQKRNLLNEMLGESKIKINDINLKSVCFAALKQELYQIKEERTIDEHEKVTSTLKELKEDTRQRQELDKEIDKSTALLRISMYLKRKAKQALQIWRKQHQRLYCVQKIWSIISFNLEKTINYSFSRIQIRRFQKLKVSIRDKIASCDYSYNYLVKENTHIKEVLDKKSHELEKAKFVAILQRLIRREKQIKHQYFYKFLRNGHKCWRVKKTLQSIDGMMSTKLKVIFFFLLQVNKKQKIHQQKITYWTQRHDQKQISNLIKKAFTVFKKTTLRNKRMRRALTGIFDRNLEINFYQAFGKMRNQSYIYELNEIELEQNAIQQETHITEDRNQRTQDDIIDLSERLKYKQETFRERKIFTLYKFFKKYYQKHGGYYLQKWKAKLDDQKKIMRFTQILDTKTQSLIKFKFLLALTKTKNQLQNKALEDKLARAENEYLNAEANFKKFESDSETRIEQMQIENVENDQLAQKYQIITDHMNDVKVASALRLREKKILREFIKIWKQKKNKFKEIWSRIYQNIQRNSKLDTFLTIAEQVKLESRNDRISRNLIRNFQKAYKHNVGLMIKTWRTVLAVTKIKENELALKQAMNDMKDIEQRYEMIKNTYTQNVNDRIRLWKLRRITNKWRIYTELKLKNNQKEAKLINYLGWEKAVQWRQTDANMKQHRKNHTKQIAKFLNNLWKIKPFFASLRIFKEKGDAKRKRITDFQKRVVETSARNFLKRLYIVCQKKHIITDLFINKFCFYSVHELSQDFFSRIKNYHHQKTTSQKDRKTFNIQKVITLFEKKRKDILCENMRIWKRNMYQMNIEKNLMRRLVRRAMNDRVKDLFYAWKLETEARFMVREHTSEGEVKKRQVEIKRLKKYLDEYKKQKGLLLQNEEGNFVVSPKFQQNKQKQLKRENLLKYKFISRVILSMNGYQAPVKAWNNLSMLTKLREKCQRCGLMVKNRMEKGDLYTGFKIWHNGVVELRKMFEAMERKDLIKILNKQKDKMEMDYSKKVEVEQRVEHELRRYKVLSYQDKRKERICAQILFREARKVKQFGFEVWRKRVQEMKDNEAWQLQEKGNNKVIRMEEEVQELERYQRQLQEQNYMLKEAVEEALELAEMIKRITEERDKLKRELSDSHISCEQLQEENQQLNNKLILAQKQAMNLLALSGSAF